MWTTLLTRTKIFNSNKYAFTCTLFIQEHVLHSFLMLPYNFHSLKKGRDSPFEQYLTAFTRGWHVPSLSNINCVVLEKK